MKNRVNRNNGSFTEQVFRSVRHGTFFRKVRRELLRIRPVYAVLSALANRHPVDTDKVLFTSFSDSISCNPKYIAQELHRQRPDLDIVWLLNEPSGQFDTERVPDGQRIVPLWSYKGMLEAGTARVLVENAQRFQLNAVPPKRKGQYYLNTWHGSLGIKKMKTVSEKVRKKAVRAAKTTDAVLTDSLFEEEVFSASIFPSVKMLRFGHPRNDIFFLSDDETAEICFRVREKIGLKSGERFALYAPTFREAEFFSASGGLRFSEWAGALKDRFGGEWRIAVRLHPHDTKWLSDGLFSLPEDVMDLSLYDDVQELLLAADACITDYSSLIFDYLFKDGGAGFIFAPDKAAYDEARGFCYPMEETPFPIAETEDALCANIRGFDTEDYFGRKKVFYEKRGCMEDGKASKRTAEWIIRRCGQPGR